MQELFRHHRVTFCKKLINLLLLFCNGAQILTAPGERSGDITVTEFLLGAFHISQSSGCIVL